MAYLGNAPARSFISFERQVFTIVNSQTAYTLSHSVTNENDIRLVINNIVQEPGSGKAYTASGTTLTLSAALTNGTDEMYCVFLGRAVATNAPAAGSVNTAAIADLNVTTAKIAADAITEAKIADDAVESEHLNNNVISGQTELAAEPADTDEFLVSDAGTLKRIDYSHIKGGGITMADQWRLTADITSNVDPISANLERVDDGSFGYIGTGMSVSSGTWTFPSTGLYQVGATIYTQPNDDSLSVNIQATTNNSSYDVISNVFGGGYQANGRTHTAFSYVNVTNTSNVKVRFGAESIAAGSIIGGNTNSNLTSFNFIRLGDSV
jgi:hypothetical protein